MVPMLKEFVMRVVSRQSILGVVVGLAVAASAIAVQAHVRGSSHAMPADRDLLSISGSPEDLAVRSERLAAHVCAVIEAGADCKLPALAVIAAADLRGLQGRHADGQQALHRALTGPVPDAAAWQAVEDEQLLLLEAASRRYLQFLAESSASLDAGQKQRFAH